MTIRRFSLLGVLVWLVSLAAAPSVAAQPPRRWLADPELAALSQYLNSGIGVDDIDVVDAQTGWAVAGHNVARFDGRHWRVAHQFDPSISLNSLDMASATYGWAVGAKVFRTSAGLFLARYDGVTWNDATTSLDPTLASGNLLDVTVHPDGTAHAVGSTGGPPLIIFFDGTKWQNQTPTAFARGFFSSLSMVSPSEGWAVGTVANEYFGTQRPVILRLKNGVWSEESLPVLPADGTFSKIIMRDVREGWAVFAERSVFTDRGDCAGSRLLHYLNGAWQLVPAEAHNGRRIYAFGLVPGTNRGWATLVDCFNTQGLVRPTRMRFDNGTFASDTSGAQLVPTVYGLLNDDVQLAAARGAFMRYSAEALPTDRVDQARPGARFFEATGHTLSGSFRTYYETHGLNLGEPGISDRESLALFGYPLSEPFEEVNPDTGELLQVQYFERARMEYHPANRNPYKVLLGRLSTATLSRQNPFRTPPEGAPQPQCNRYPETGYDLCPPLRAYWEQNGGLPIFGYPITQARNEVSQTDGKTYLTQYFERERMEYHPENTGTPYEVLLGLLGAEELRVRGYLP